jgi:hypothetical protein
MLPSSVVPGFLAAGPTVGRLPYPMVPLGAQRVVRAALRHAWAVVQARAEEHGLRTASEPQITAILQFALNELLDDEAEPVAGFSSSYFETVERGAEMVNYSGAHLEKRPDLRFRVHGRVPGVPDRTHYGLFVECKLLGATHPLGVYAKNGIRRFVNGEYAWAMPHGVMIAYVRADGPARSDLVRFLNDRKREYSVVSAAEASGDEDLVESSHERAWQYPSSRTAPGPIELIHVWLSLT